LRLPTSSSLPHGPQPLPLVQPLIFGAGSPPPWTGRPESDQPSTNDTAIPTIAAVQPRMRMVHPPVLLVAVSRCLPFRAKRKTPRNDEWSSSLLRAPQHPQLVVAAVVARDELGRSIALAHRKGRRQAQLELLSIEDVNAAHQRPLQRCRPQ